MSASRADEPLDPAQEALWGFLIASRVLMLEEIADCMRAHEAAERAVKLEAEHRYPGQPWRHFAPPALERQFEMWVQLERLTGMADG